jgi:hypothetical protein
MRTTGWPASIAALPRGERRRVTRGAVGEPERAQLVALVLGTFKEMHGTRLTVTEAVRLFGLREATCRLVLDDLVQQKRLRRAHDGRYAAA